MEDARLIRPAPDHQKMKMRVEIDPVAEGLDDSNDLRLKLLPCQSLTKNEFAISL